MLFYEPFLALNYLINILEFDSDLIKFLEFAIWPIDGLIRFKLVDHILFVQFGQNTETKSRKYKCTCPLSSG